MNFSKITKTKKKIYIEKMGSLIKEKYKAIKFVEAMFCTANLLRARYELEMQRGSTTEEYIEMIKISSSFINK